MKKYLEVIWKIVSSNIFAYVIAGGILFFAFQQCESKKDLVAEKTKLEQNIKAKNDSIETYKLKNGTLVKEKGILILSEKELKKENSDLYKQVKQQSGSIITLNNAVLSLKQDTELLNDKIRYLRAVIDSAKQIGDNRWEMPWTLEYVWNKDSTNYDRFRGKTFVSVVSKTPLKLQHDNTMMLERESKINITFGEKVTKDGKYNVYLESKYPGFDVEQMKGVFIDPNTNKDIKRLMKKQHWFTGFSFGVSVVAGKDLFSNGMGVMVGPSLTWNIYQW